MNTNVISISERSPTTMSPTPPLSFAFDGVPAPMTLHTILVVDDDPHIRELIAQALIDEGYAVVTAGDGQAAVELVAMSPPALILLDLMMPRMAGWQVVSVLKTLPDAESIPVVLLSANHNLNQMARQLGTAAYLAKPFDLDALLNIVATYVPPVPSEASTYDIGPSPGTREQE
jgi:CheY-like chemotaxis protein